MQQTSLSAHIQRKYWRFVERVIYKERGYSQTECVYSVWTRLATVDQ